MKDNNRLSEESREQKYLKYRNFMEYLISEQCKLDLVELKNENEKEDLPPNNKLGLSL